MSDDRPTRPAGPPPRAEVSGGNGPSLTSDSGSNAVVRRERALARRYLVEKLKDPASYVVAAFVGTFINAYGQLLVPWLRGANEPWQRFVGEFREAPGVVCASLLLAYAFPLCVNVFSAVAARYAGRRFEARALFSDYRFNPVFRALPTGEVVDAGLRTAEAFEALGIRMAQSVLGNALWARLVRAAQDQDQDQAQDGRGLRNRAVVYSEALDAWYQVGHVAGPDGTLQVFMQEADSPAAAPRRGARRHRAPGGAP